MPPNGPTKGPRSGPAPSARSSATRRSWRSAAASEAAAGPIAAAAGGAAAGYFAAVIVLAIAGADASALQASADLVADGEVWRLLTSALVVDGVAAPQIALTALAAFAVIRLVGPGVWWAAVLVGHVGSALIAYAIIGVAIAFGSAGAEAAADDPDFGISCVLGATLGALFASGWRVVGAVGFVLLLPFSLDWYGPEHPLSFVLGALVARRRPCRPARRSAGFGSALQSWPGCG